MAVRNRLADEFEEARKAGKGIEPGARDSTGSKAPTPGQRPFPADPKNLAPIEEEIKRVKSVNAGHRILTGTDAAHRRREGQLRNPRNG